jgi:hypothetical protein
MATASYPATIKELESGVLYAVRADSYVTQKRTVESDVLHAVCAEAT